MRRAVSCQSPSMVLPGVDCAWAEQPSAEASRTVASLIMPCPPSTAVNSDGTCDVPQAVRRLQESYAPGLQLVNGADELQDAFGHPRLALRRFVQLPHRPAHVGLDCGLELRFGAAARTQVLEPRKDALEQQRDAAALARAFELGGHGRLDGTAALV